MCSLWADSTKDNGTVDDVVGVNWREINKKTCTISSCSDWYGRGAQWL